jgi:hypothetical protein
MDETTETLRRYFDGTGIALLKQIESLGFTVIIRAEGRNLVAHDRAGACIEAANDEPYIAACKLAALAGIDLEG